MRLGLRRPLPPALHEFPAYRGKADDEPPPPARRQALLMADSTLPALIKQWLGKAATVPSQ